MDNLIIGIFISSTILVIVFGVSMYFVITNLYKQLRKKEIESVELIIAGQEREREIISRELHDNLGPILSITQMQIGFLLENAKDAISRELLSKAFTHLQDSIKRCRNISHLISTNVSSEKSFRTAVNEVIDSINLYGKINIELVMPADLPHLDWSKGTSMIRIIQELLLNSIRHANADTVAIQININAQTLAINFCDNGIGFQLSDVKLGLGIQNIKKRVDILGGKVSWKLAENNGTEVEINLPIKNIVRENSVGR